jgi:arabinogalactan endo-1,4-beta-galactosidase
MHPHSSLRFAVAARFFAILAVLVALLAMPSMASAKMKPLDPANLPFLAGGDISLLTWEEQHGTVYKDNGKPEDMLKIFKDHGCNFMRLRIWVNPSEKGIFVNDLPYTVALGKRIKKAGLYLDIDFHYSDSWADPGKQIKPAAWRDLPFDELVSTMQAYTRDVIAAMRKGGALPDIVQIGNEITPGMLWPDGRDTQGGHDDFTNLATLLKAGIAGVKEGAGKDRQPLILIHIDRGGDWKGTKWFFDNINQQGVPYDIIGLSYYPFFHGPLPNLKETLDNAAQTFHKPIIVVETGYPFMSMGVKGPNSSALSYPLTVEGQRDFLKDLVSTIHQTPDGLGKGVLYWAPEWIPVKTAPGSWEGTTLFDNDGNALPGLYELAGPPAQSKP